MHNTPLRRVLAVGFLALLVATAGCSGVPLLGDDEEDGDTGYGLAGDELNGTVLENESAAAVESAGSYTSEERIHFEYPDDDNISYYEQITTKRVDLANETGIKEAETESQTFGNTSNSSTVVYTDGDTSYQERIDEMGEVSYSSSEDPYSFISGVNVTHYEESYENLVEGLAWENTGDEGFNGVGVTRYEVGGVDNKTKLFGENSTVESVSGTMLIDEQGLVHQLNFSTTYELDGETVSGEVNWTLSAVGETTVEEPDWLGKAKADE